MVDMNEVEALLDVITTLQIQMQAIIMLLEETGVTNAQARVDATLKRIDPEKYKDLRAAIQDAFEKSRLERRRSS